jgi:hypothetical protein
MLKPNESPKGMAGHVRELHNVAYDANTKMFAIASLALALRHILGSTEERDDQPIASAITLCAMIEKMAEAEANGADEIGLGLYEIEAFLNKEAQAS